MSLARLQVNVRIKNDDPGVEPNEDRPRWFENLTQSRAKRRFASSRNGVNFKNKKINEKKKLRWKCSVRLKNRQLNAHCTLRKWKDSAAIFAEVSTEHGVT